jgi:hypothetical protein
VFEEIQYLYAFHSLCLSLRDQGKSREIVRYQCVYKDEIERATLEMCTRLYKREATKWDFTSRVKSQRQKEWREKLIERHAQLTL